MNRYRLLDYLVSWTVTLALICATLTLFCPLKEMPVYPQLSQQMVDRLANAIYWSEGGPAAKVPYGILSVKVASPAEARAVCERTIRHQWALFCKRRSNETFVVFLGKTYCPPAVDPEGYVHWIKNVNWFIRHNKIVYE